MQTVWKLFAILLYLGMAKKEFVCVTTVATKRMDKF